jgi:hypothetical protein
MIRVCCDQGLIDIKAYDATTDASNNLVLTMGADVVAIFRCDCWSYFQVVDDE